MLPRNMNVQKRYDIKKKKKNDFEFDPYCAKK